MALSLQKLYKTMKSVTLGFGKSRLYQSNFCLVDVSKPLRSDTSNYALEKGIYGPLQKGRCRGVKLCQ
jgi:hypothetical protein